eukprot:GHVU01131633.1.p1 GENE.GHVU01131633.1~~GHVU01131633.1.p1  ORF type:complete len:630 (-),score=97.72 GHVU01131633.1:7-1896(-)
MAMSSRYDSAANAAVEEVLPSPSFWYHPPGAIGPMRWTSVRRSARKLQNSGNTCFSNMALLALMHCPPLTEDLLNSTHSRHCPARRRRLRLRRRSRNGSEIVPAAGGDCEGLKGGGSNARFRRIGLGGAGRMPQCDNNGLDGQTSSDTDDNSVSDEQECGMCVMESEAKRIFDPSRQTEAYAPRIFTAMKRSSQRSSRRRISRATAGRGRGGKCGGGDDENDDDDDDDGGAHKETSHCGGDFHYLEPGEQHCLMEQWTLLYDWMHRSQFPPSQSSSHHMNMIGSKVSTAKRGGVGGATTAASRSALAVPNGSSSSSTAAAAGLLEGRGVDVPSTIDVCDCGGNVIRLDPSHTDCGPSDSIPSKQGLGYAPTGSCCSAYGDSSAPSVHQPTAAADVRLPLMTTATAEAATSYLSQIFGGSLVNRLTCQTCSHTRHRVEYFHDVLLPPDGSPDRVVRDSPVTAVTFANQQRGGGGGNNSSRNNKQQQPPPAEPKHCRGSSSSAATSKRQPDSLTTGQEEEPTTTGGGSEPVGDGCSGSSSHAAAAAAAEQRTRGPGGGVYMRRGRRKCVGDSFQSSRYCDYGGTTSITDLIAAEFDAPELMKGDNKIMYVCMYVSQSLHRSIVRIKPSPCL